ncbi:MAG: translation initiation factor IF-2 [Erysipelotrichaceae bacterium]|nr:translation initiation factor IF-2 [Erysipelotrichaceae bacterium]
MQRRTKTTVSSTTAGGKAKAVQVEVRKKRTVPTDAARKAAEAEKLKAQQEAEKKAAEEKARLAAEKAAAEKAKAEKAKVEAEKAAKPAQSAVENKPKSVDPEKEKRKAEEAELRRKAEELAHQKAEEQARKAAEDAKRYAEVDTSSNESASEDYTDYNLSSRYALEAEDEEERRNENRGRGKNKVAKAKKERDDVKGGNKNERESNRKNQKDGKFGKGKNGKKGAALQQAFTKPVQVVKQDVVIGETITVAELANKMATKATEIIKAMMKMGEMVTINQVLDQETAQLVAEELGHKVILRNENELEEEVLGDRDVNAEKVTRAPVVTIMGHVDHGKTSLLDYIRKAKVAAGEAGGITQHIGAYHVEMDDGKMITFLDTPGHAAFTSMRARGAKATDIVVLVVAADDGVMPQTKEAIDHAKAAGVPIVVAINKIDKEGADPERIKAEMAEEGLLPEEWGGDTVYCEISAKKKIGIEELLETLTVVAELADLKANPNRYAYGSVVEGKLDKGRGAVATLLVENGTLRASDPIVVGAAYGRVRQMLDDKGRVIKEALPGTPVEITGLNEVPVAGDKFMVFETEKQARSVGETRMKAKIEKDRNSGAALSLDDLYSQIKEGQIIDLNIIVKADVQGTAEAVKASLEKIDVDGVRVNVIRSTVGAISESDVILASASQAIIYGFNVRPDAKVRNKAEEENVEIRLHNVIYKMVEEIETAMKGMLAPEYHEVITGQAEIRQVIKASKVGNIAGCYVTDGSIKRNCGIRLIRDGIVVYEGKLASLRRFKDDVKEVNAGFECGLNIENYNDIKEGDIIEGYVMEEVEKK